MIPDRELKILVIGGVRPQYIKIAALQRAVFSFNNSSKMKINATYINSAQHYDDELSKDIISELGIFFDYTLSHLSRSPIEMLGSMIVGIYKILDDLEVPPDWVIVIGDTTTTMAGAIAASRKLFPIVHIEAGVRSRSLDSIEETHRRIVSHISSVHFCYSKNDVGNLMAENIVNNVFWTGDLAYDLFSDFIAGISSGFASLPTDEYILVTLHKPQNLFSNEILPTLISTLNNQSRPVLFVTHPRCRQRLQELDLIKGNKIKFISSLGYSEMLSALKGCAYVITDSGGIRKESFYLNKPCLVRKDSVGWLAPFISGQSKLIGKSDFEKELEWAEQRLLLLKDMQPDIGDFVRENAGIYTLEKLIELAK